MSQLWLDGLLRKMENTGFFQVRKSTNLCLTFKDTEHDLLEDPVVEDMIQCNPDGPLLCQVGPISFNSFVSPIYGLWTF